MRAGGHNGDGQVALAASELASRVWLSRQGRGGRCSACPEAETLFFAHHCRQVCRCAAAAGRLHGQPAPRRRQRGDRPPPGQPVVADGADMAVPGGRWRGYLCHAAFRSCSWLPSPRDLDICGASDACLAAAAAMPSLRQLSAAGCGGLGAGAGAPALAAGPAAAMLCWLDIAGTAAGDTAAAAGCRQLLGVNLTGCQGLSPAGVEHLSRLLCCRAWALAGEEQQQGGHSVHCQARNCREATPPVVRCAVAYDMPACVNVWHQSLPPARRAGALRQ